LNYVERPPPIDQADSFVTARVRPRQRTIVPRRVRKHRFIVLASDFAMGQIVKRSGVLVGQL